MLPKRPAESGGWMPRRASRLLVEHSKTTLFLQSFRRPTVPAIGDRKGALPVFFEREARVMVSPSLIELSYLVDPASSDTLPSKIKPCMSQYSLDKVKPQTAH